MDSLNNLFISLKSIYLGSFFYITYQMIFYHQKKFLLIKTLIYFTFITFLIIKIKSTYNFNFILYIGVFFILGVFMGRKIFKDSLIKYNKPIKNFNDYISLNLKYYFKLLLIPPITYFVYCKIKTFIFYKKNPRLKL